MKTSFVPTVTANCFQVSTDGSCIGYLKTPNIGLAVFEPKCLRCLLVQELTAISNFVKDLENRKALFSSLKRGSAVKIKGSCGNTLAGKAEPCSLGWRLKEKPYAGIIDVTNIISVGGRKRAKVNG